MMNLLPPRKGLIIKYYKRFEKRQELVVMKLYKNMLLQIVLQEHEISLPKGSLPNFNVVLLIKSPPTQ